MKISFQKDPFGIEKKSDTGLLKHGDLEWEEGAVDQHSKVEGFSEESDLEPRTFWWLRASLGIAALILVGQLINLQVVQGGKFRELSDGNRLRLQTILAPRGFITDRYSQPLAKNTASFNLAVTPVDVPEDNYWSIYQKFAELFQISPEEIDQLVKDSIGGPLDPVLIKRNISQQESIKFEVHAGELPGFSLVNNPVRDYLSPEIFSHALGYTGVISETEYQELENEGYGLNDFIGKSGIELSYEKYLRGINGNKQVEVDASGNAIKVLGVVEPEPGNIVELNIDKELQEKLYQEFSARGTTNKGAAVALNPKTGEVLALVSVPGFNNNLFAPGIKTADYKALVENPNLPLFNRAISGVYPPGSTIKMVTAAAALQDGQVSEDTVIYDGGVLVINNQFNPSIKYNFVGWKRSGLGPMTVTSAIAESSDIYFYTVAGGHPSSTIEGLGAEKLADYYRDFGMGAPTGIDIQGEKSGIVADPDWKAEFHAGDPISSKWYLGDTYHIAIGQGDMLATPLQVANWTAAIANNGSAYKPRLLRRVIAQTGEVIYEPTPELVIKPSVTSDVMKVVQEGMRLNVIGAKGSGRQLQSLPISAAGKTGTSQFDGSDPSRTHAWYTAYAPYEDPQIVVTVLVEAGGEGHAAAVPIVKATLEWWAEHRYNK
ncbi:MAG: penicillin-binding protein 2 [Candidatus Doudnabacteria bacterium]